MLTFNTLESLAEMAPRLSQYDSDSLGRILNEDGVVRLPAFLPPKLLHDLDQQADKLLNDCGRRIDVRVRSTGNTPRKYVSVRRDDVFTHSHLMQQLYFEPTLIRFIAKLTRSDVIVAPYEPEQVVVNRMNQEGDTHGWHWDDYSYSLVMVLAAPQKANGAQVEYVDGTHWCKDAPEVEKHLRKPARSLDLERGSAYVLLGKRVMHRVSPMLRSDTRKIICFTYATKAERSTCIDHASMQDIYG